MLSEGICARFLGNVSSYSSQKEGTRGAARAQRKRKADLPNQKIGLFGAPACARRTRCGRRMALRLQVELRHSSRHFCLVDRFLSQTRLFLGAIVSFASVCIAFVSRIEGVSKEKMVSSRRRAALIVLSLVSVVLAQGSTNWTVDGRYPLLNGEPFLFKGINYSPIPIGSSQTDDNLNRGDVFTSEYSFIHERDLPALRASGANSVRLYDVWPWKYPSIEVPQWTQATDLDHTAFLDACWNNGANPIYVWMTHHMGTSFHVATTTGMTSPDGRPTWRLTNGLTAYLDPSWDATDSTVLMYTRNAFTTLASKYGSHPAITGFVISNEQNSDQVRGSWQFWRWFDETAALVKQLAPNKLTAMTLVDDGIVSISYAESFNVTNVEVWGINSYRGTLTTGFDTLFTSFASASNKPLIIGEYGPPASTRDQQGNIIELPNNAEAQAEYINVHWDDITAHRSICSGGFIFEWTDEWWKHDNPSLHDASTVVNAAYPGGYGDEEWFGVNAVSLITPTSDPAAYNTRGADILEPRAALATISTMFATEPPVPPQAPPTPISIIPIAPLSPFAPTIVPQNNPTTPISTTPVAIPTHSPTPNSPLTTSPTGKASPTSDATTLLYSRFPLLMVPIVALAIIYLDEVSQ